MQKQEDKDVQKDRDYQRILRTAIVTAGNAPSHKRVITTLEKWVLSNYDAIEARTAFNELISTRGSVAHQANTSSNPDCELHLIKRDELDKAIRFLTGLVAATDSVRIVK